MAFQALQVCFLASYSKDLGLNNWVDFESVILDHLTLAFLQTQLGEFGDLRLDEALTNT